MEDLPDGFIFVLPFLDLRSRLTVEMVSKPLREAMKDNPLIWQHLHVEGPVSRKLTDKILLRLAERAEGHLKSLSLVECLRISETALDQVLTLNPGIEKLSVPGCIGISAKGIVRLVELHSLESQAKGMPGIKQLQIRGLYNITKKHLELLHRYLQPLVDHQDPSESQRSQFYGYSMERYDMPKPIDVQVCPICQDVRVVYDCSRLCMPFDSQHNCRGCRFCIPRCEECGRCFKVLTLDESVCPSVCPGWVCTECWLNLPKCSECNRAVCGHHAPQFLGGCSTFTCEDCFTMADYQSDESWEI